MTATSHTKDIQLQPKAAEGGQDDAAVVLIDTNGNTAIAADANAAQCAKPRTYYVDWLRVFLTVVVLVHHCVTSYQTSQAWKAKRGDTALWLLSMVFVYANQAYFMTLFFFLSGLYVPGSYKRKGCWSFLYDRTLRLVVPCLFYSMLIAPWLIWWGRLAVHAADPAKNPRPSLGDAFAEWFAPGWPPRYNLPVGPPWFIWMLWCFNVAYVLLRVLGDFVFRRVLHRTGSSSGRAKQLPVSAARSEYTTRQWMVGVAILTVVFFVLQYAARAFDMAVFDIRPAQFVAKQPFMSFMPDYFVVYAAAFALGIYSGPAGWNVLARLPSGKAAWLLGIGGLWWTLAGFVPNVMLHSYMSMQYGMGPFLGTWFLRTFVEQSFAVIWSVGLLILFRDHFNILPNWFGKQVIGAAYGAYIIHWPIIALFSRALMFIPSPSAVINATSIAVPVVVSSWLVAAVVRAIPGADRIL